MSVLKTNFIGGDETGSMYILSYQVSWYVHIYIVGSRGASQLGGSLLGIPPGFICWFFNRTLSIYIQTLDPNFSIQSYG